MSRTLAYYKDGEYVEVNEQDPLPVNSVGGSGEPASPTNGAPVTLYDAAGNPIFPAASTLADDESNATLVSRIGARLQGFDGTTWDRLRTALANGNSFSGSDPDGLLAIVPYFHDSTSGAFLPIKGARGIGDASNGDTLQTVAGMLYDGTTWNKHRNNLEGTLLASAARTATTNSTDQVNYNGRGVRVFFNVTVAPGVETLTPAIEVKDPIGGAYSAILTGAAKSDTGLVVLTLYPGATVAANVTLSNVLSRTWRVSVTHSASGSFTYSVAYGIML